MVFGMGPLELMIILGIALLIFGPKNLPKLGKSLGQTVKNVREGMEGDDESVAVEKHEAFRLLFVMTMFYGVEFETISKERLLVAGKVTA